jgi:sugar phosphate isomerase/epimerase
VHLSDCDGKVHGDLPPGRGCTPIKEYLAAIRDTGFDGVVSIELEFSPEPSRILDWVTEAYEQTDRIMRELNCRA